MLWKGACQKKNHRLPKPCGVKLYSAKTLYTFGQAQRTIFCTE
jgi:hypothetical protein